MFSVSAVVEIARPVRKYVVARASKRKDDLLRASAAGCDRFQGYYFLAGRCSSG